MIRPDISLKYWTNGFPFTELHHAGGGSESWKENANAARTESSFEVSQDFGVLRWPDSIQASRKTGFFNFFPLPSSGCDIKGGETGPRSGPRAEIEKTKERLLRLHTEQPLLGRVGRAKAKQDGKVSETDVQKAGQ